MFESIAIMGGSPDREGIYPSSKEYVGWRPGCDQYQDTPAFIRYIERMERRTNALSSLPTLLKSRIDAAVGTCKSELESLARAFPGATTENILLAADFYQWYPAKDDISLIFEAKNAALAKRNLWHQYLHEELPSLKDSTIEDICSELGVSVPDFHYHVPDNETAKKREERKNDYKTKKFQLLSQRYKIASLDQNRVAQLTAAMNLHNAQLDRDEYVSSKVSETDSLGQTVNVDLRHSSTVRAKMKSLFKREMNAWADLLERHGFEFVTLFADGFGSGNAHAWGTNTGLTFEKTQLSVFQNGISGFNNFVASQEARKHKSMYSAMVLTGMFPEMWSRYKEVRDANEKAAAERRLISDSEAANARKRKRTRKEAEATTDGVPSQLATGEALGTGNVPNPITTAENGPPNSIPDPATPSPNSPTALAAPAQQPQAVANSSGTRPEGLSEPDPNIRQGQLPQDPFQQPATVPNLFAQNLVGLPTPAPSSPSALPNLFLNPPDTIALQTALATSITAAARSALLDATEVASSPPAPQSSSMILRGPSTPSRRAPGTMSAASTPRTPRNFQRISPEGMEETLQELMNGRVKKPSTSAKRRQERNDALHADILTIWNSAFPEAEDITGFVSRRWAEKKLAESNKSWVGVTTDHGELYKKAKSAESYRAIRTGVDAGTIRIEAIV